MDGIKFFGPMGGIGGLGFMAMGDGDLTPELMSSLVDAAFAAARTFADAAKGAGDACGDCDDCDDVEMCDYHLHCYRCDDRCEAMHADKRWKNMKDEMDTYLSTQKTELKRRSDGGFDVVIKPTKPPCKWKDVLNTVETMPRSIGGLIKRAQDIADGWGKDVEKAYLDGLVCDVTDYLSLNGYEMDGDDIQDVSRYLHEKVRVTADESRLLGLAFMELKREEIDY